ncbi:speckle-type POZ protein [Trichonephila clavata]|uniref:Speckle-type POZ protein n=1 Tax=Trichonephila clavata TaxID=2740835 RepID=A0A8X6I8H0_TRICU|nr:speckle-type POZ protein [Trichonephila clavata]
MNNHQKGEFLWKIENFSSCRHWTGEGIISPIFSSVLLFDTEWRLHLYPRGKKNGKYLSCYLEYLEDNQTHLERVNFEISILARGDTTFRLYKGNSRYIRIGNILGFNRFCIRKSIFKSKDIVLLDDTLRIKCHLTLNVSVEETQDANLEELCQNFRNMFESGSFSDLSLSTSDEVFKVHRVLICARAPKFAAELGIIRDETFSNNVKINGVSSLILKAFLSYLYSGQLGNLSADVLVGLYEMAENYDLKHLKQLIFPRPVNIEFKTRIEAIRKSVLWSIENFSTRERKDFPVYKFVNLQLVHLVLTCSLTDDSENGDSFQVCIRRVKWKNTSKIYFRCRISVMETLDDLIGSKEYEKWFQSDRLEYRFPILNMRKNRILENVVYLPNDVLQLCLDFAVSDGRQTSEVESESCSWTTPVEEQSRFLSVRQLREDLKNLWITGNLTDATIQAQEEKLEVHKAVLAMRSPVFHKMLQDCSFEDKVIHLDLSDLSLEIIWELLKYVYRGEIHVYTFERYMQLYIAALKYGLPSLAEQCKLFLVSKLTDENVCEILVLADVHHDELLFNAAREYISENKHLVLNSSEWENLLTHHPQLASKLLLWLSLQIL